MKKILSLLPILVSLNLLEILLPKQVYAQALIKDFIPGPNTYHNINTIVPIKNNLAYFNNNSAVWKTDGTCMGTELIKDFGIGTPYKFTQTENSKVFFSALDVDHSTELWATNGTEASTYLVKDIQLGSSGSYPDHLCAHHNLLYFAATTTAAGEELWRSDGTNAGTYMVSNLRPGSNSSNPSYLIIFKDSLFFTANNGNGWSLWKSDGTNIGTVLVKDFVPASTLGSAGYLTVAGNKLFLRVNDNVNGAELWVSDGSTAGTQMVKDINPGNASAIDAGVPFEAVGNILYFPADDGVHGEELWRSDGTPAGTYMVKDIYAGANPSYIDEIAHVGGTVFLNASSVGFGDELWRSDGTEAGTMMVKDINQAPSASASPNFLTATSNGLYFSAFDGVHGYELWWTDGTEMNTMLVKDIEPGIKGSNPTSLTPINNEVVFIAETTISGKELWSTGPTPSGPPVNAIVDEIIPENCSGQNTGAINITVTAGNCPFVYQWTGPFNNKYYTEDLSNLWAGTYTLTLTDAKGTSKVLTCIVGEPMSLSASYSNNTPPDCLGNSGAFTIQAQGGVPPYTYLWNNGVVGPTQSNIPFPGDHFDVSITDANGCTTSGTFGTYAEQPYMPVLRVNHPVSCYGDQALIYAPIGSKQDLADKILSTLYHWEAGPGGQIVSDPNQVDIIVHGAATYYLTATASSSSCTLTQSIVVSADSLPPLANAGPDLLMNCSTDELILAGAASANGHAHAQLQISWEAFDGGAFVSSPYGTMPTINRPGTYVLTVKNQYNGCINRDTVQVLSQKDGPSLTVVGSPQFCTQDTISLSALWDDTLADFDGWYTMAGLYSTNPELRMPESEGWTYVIAKAHQYNGCVTETRVDLLRNNQPAFVALSADTLGCGGVPIKVAYSFPYENLVWSWSGPNGFTHQGKEVIAYEPGAYFLSLQAGDCLLFDTIQVVGEASIHVNGSTLFAPSCPGQSDGYIQLWDIRGAWPYQILWSNGDIGNVASNLAPGHYWAGISGGESSDSECYIQKDFYVPYPDSVQILLEVINDPNGGNNGAINTTVTGAPPPYNYHWSNGATTASITGLAPGLYTLTLTFNPDFGCTSTQTAEVLWMGCALEVAETTHQNNVCTGETAGQIEIEPLGGTPPYTFLWSNGATNYALTDLATGPYSLTTTDANGCSSILETEILSKDTMPPKLSCMDNIVVGSCQNVVNFKLPDVADEPCTAFDQSRMIQLAGLPSGANFPTGTTVQSFQYTKLNGLRDSCSFMITIAAEPSSFGVQVIPLSCFGICTGAIQLNVEGGAPPFSYQWADGQTNAALSDLCGGAYEVTISDLYGCTWVLNPNVMVPAPLILVTGSVMDDTNSTGVGAINLTFGGGVAPYSFAWYMDSILFDTTESLSGLYAGQYYCVITDANACTQTSSLITVNNLVSTHESPWTGFSLIPNPASGEVQILFSRAFSSTPKILIYDGLGRFAEGIRIRQNSPDQIVLEVSDTPPGIYWVQLLDSERRGTLKLVVVH